MTLGRFIFCLRENSCRASSTCFSNKLSCCEIDRYFCHWFENLHRKITTSIYVRWRLSKCIFYFDYLRNFLFNKFWLFYKICLQVSWSIFKVYTVFENCRKCLICVKHYSFLVKKFVAHKSKYISRQTSSTSTRLKKT